VNRLPSGPSTALRIILLVSLLVLQVVVLPKLAVAQTAPAIETEGEVWADPTVTVLITPSTGESWYAETYADDAAHGVRRWAQSIIVFTDDYSSHSYLRQLSFGIFIFGRNSTVPSSPDVRVSFVQSFPGVDTHALGVTTYGDTLDNHFDPPVTIRLAAQDPVAHVQLSDEDMVNIATHEFGHALGLGHTNMMTTDDNFLELMSTTYNLPVGNVNNPLEAPSTLDLYALATIYNYLATSPTLTGPGSEARTLTLPVNMPYTAEYPYPEQVEALKTGLAQANQRIIILAILTAVLLAITMILTILLVRRKPPPALRPPYPPEPAPLTAQNPNVDSPLEKRQ
jgi:hypothetical protein